MQTDIFYTPDTKRTLNNIYTNSFRRGERTIVQILNLCKALSKRLSKTIVMIESRA